MVTLTDEERDELLRRKSYYPFRQWFAVKTAAGEVEYFDSVSKATVHANANAPAVMWAAQ